MAAWGRRRRREQRQQFYVIRASLNDGSFEDFFPAPKQQTPTVAPRRRWTPSYAR